MESKHTPGPWRVDGLFLNQLGVWASTGAIVAEIRLGSHENADGTDTAMENDEYDANAALIAAAPELLYAAIAALDCLERPHAERDENRVRVMLDVAVAKAEERA